MPTAVSSSATAPGEDVQNRHCIDFQDQAPLAQNLTGATTSTKHWGILQFRPFEDDDEQDWWFASTAIPLIAATVGPLANVLSIAALVTYWRMRLNVGPNGDNVSELEGEPFKDPAWCTGINSASLACGFAGNLFLLANFTNRIRYIIALPATIIFWSFSTAMLIGIILSINIYAPPDSPTQTYTQGFWYGIIAATLYMFASMILMINMLGYFLGHYPQHFNLTEAQRTLILQTMMFFIWLAGGAGVFTAVESRAGGYQWGFVDSLYFCDVTILTVGFGDLVPSNDLGRGLVFPYSIGGIIMLGLVIGSLSRFASELSQDNIIRKRVETKRARTVERSTPKSPDVDFPPRANGYHRHVSGPYILRMSADHLEAEDFDRDTQHKTRGLLNRHRRRRPAAKRSRALILREEKDRFNAMREIQRSTRRFKTWTGAAVATVAFGVLWCVGAVVFWVAEANTQGLSYFQALYFCYVSLLTIGYGDLSPKSNAGRPFFVVWSLLAVPTMTILVSTLGDIVISKFKRGTSRVADFTILPQYGIWRDFINRFGISRHIQMHQERKAAARRIEAGFETGPGSDDEARGQRIAPTLEDLAQEGDARKGREEHVLAKKLAVAIKRTAHEIQDCVKRRYSYEEWVELTELIRFTSRLGSGPRDDEKEESEGTVEALIEWDWIGENSPMMQRQSEPMFVLDRLCESMARYVRFQARKAEHGTLLRNSMGVGTGDIQAPGSVGHGNGDMNVYNSMNEE